MDTSQIPIALTMGEPAGVGGEIALKAWLGRGQDIPAFCLIDDPERLRALATQTSMDVPIVEITSADQVCSVFNDALPVLPLGQRITSHPGAPDTSTAQAVCTSIEMAVGLAMKGLVSSVVTNPIQKNTLYDIGFSYPGHTEYVAHLSGGDEPVMMLASPMLRVVPVSVHVALAQAIRDLDTQSIVRKGRITAQSLRTDFGIENPRIAVAGLNPHAGESGTMGDEEARIIVPAIETLRSDGLDVVGPIPPDALFTPRMRATYDVALCHYHDQALIPLKALDVDNAVNVTIGLPVVRTSPDHGTALDIAGTGQADAQSLMVSLRMARDIATRRADALTMDS